MPKRRIPATWKAFELRIAEVFGGERRGAYTGSNGEGKSDVIHHHYSIECKLLGAPTYGAMLAACRQAEANAETPLHEPVAVIKRKNARLKDALVVMRLETFRDWRLSPGDPVSETRRDENGVVIREKDGKWHGEEFHCECGSVIHESKLGDDPDPRAQLTCVDNALMALAKRERSGR